MGTRGKTQGPALGVALGLEGLPDPPELTPGWDRLPCLDAKPLAQALGVRAVVRKRPSGGGVRVGRGMGGRLGAGIRWVGGHGWRADAAALRRVRGNGDLQGARGEASPQRVREGRGIPGPLGTGCFESSGMGWGIQLHWTPHHPKTPRWKKQYVTFKAWRFSHPRTD